MAKAKGAKGGKGAKAHITHISTILNAELHFFPYILDLVFLLHSNEYNNNNNEKFLHFFDRIY